MSKIVNVQLTEKQAHLLTSLLSDLSGQVKYRAMKLADTPAGTPLDQTAEVWQNIAVAVSEPIGRKDEILSAQEPKGSIHIDRMLKVVRREA